MNQFPGAFPTVTVESIFGGWLQNAIDVGDDGFFLELAAKIQIQRFLEEECNRQEELWSNRMVNLQELVAQTKLPTPVITRVDHKNIYTGARPSLLQAPIDFWPSITVRCGDLRPSRSQADNYDVFDADFFVEVMTYAGPISKERTHMQEGIDSEGNVNLQTHLLSCAVQMCLRRDPSWGGAIMPVQRPPNIRPSFPTALPGTDRHRVGDTYLYQGRQHHYVITRNSI